MAPPTAGRAVMGGRACSAVPEDRSKRTSVPATARVETSAQARCGGA